MKKPFILDHPLVQHKLSILRRTTTGTKDFRDLISEIGTLLCYEATRDLELEPVEIETPMCKCIAKQIKGKAPVIVPILRAGLGMVDGVQKLMPSSRVGHIGLYRDEETAQ
ncbi:MAG: uracil phosphoribosyltransferase, partial [Oscillospiraceae bacterium]|nr:uracil phosphoribosyltransferase [Oscillospiraceae bacterium]